MRLSVAWLVLVVAGLGLAGCAANDTAGHSAQASATVSKKRVTDGRASEPWTLQTPFGIIYGQTPRETVEYSTKLSPGSIVVSTGERRLYYVLGEGKAIRYAIAVGMEGYGWSGTNTVSMKREWPDWSPTPRILARFPNLPRHMEGGADNPLGARALYLGATLYRIHGTNEPWKVGGGVSSGCIRMSNEDVIDLYDRTRIGATVVVR